MKDVQFGQTRKALQLKERDLKQKGMGTKPNASAALSEEDIQVLFEKDLLESSTAEALLNRVWFNDTIHFGYRGYKETREMKTDDAPFYLAVSNVKSGCGKPRLKKTPVGGNKLNTLMKTVAQKAGLGPNFKNLSGRNTMIQTLVNNDVPPTDIRVV